MEEIIQQWVAHRRGQGVQPIDGRSNKLSRIGVTGMRRSFVEQDLKAIGNDYAIAREIVPDHAANHNGGALAAECRPRGG